MTDIKEAVEFLWFSQLENDRVQQLLSQCLMSSSFLSLRSGIWDKNANIITGQCDLFGINELDITLAINPSTDILLKVELKKLSNVIIRGLEWIKLNNINLSLLILKDEKKGN